MQPSAPSAQTPDIHSTSTGSAVIALSNPKSPINVGAVLRACACFGHDQVYYTGTRFEVADRFRADTRNARDKVALNACADLTALRQPHQQLVAVDYCVGATALPQFEHPEHAIYVFGPEDGSVEQSVIDAADHVVFIPTHTSLNLAVTVNLVLYDRIAKQPALDTPDDFIKTSRDVNNRLRIKTAE